MTAPSFREFMKHTKPGPSRRCETCGTVGLRRYTDPDTKEERVVCVNIRCTDSPLHGVAD